MAIKWKKRKISIVFVYVAAVSLLIMGVMGFIQGGLLRRNLKSCAETLRESDFQETDDFKNFISYRLIDLLGMACGDYTTGIGYYGEDYGFDSSDVSERTDIIEAEENYDGAGQLQEEEVSGTVSEAGKRKAADNFHRQIQADKNILYSVTYNGKTNYSNLDDISWKYDPKEQSLPEGYNFLLHFDGTKVTIQKDGRETDVYGDGIYREDEDWYLPGYKNFTAKEKWKDADIFMLVSKEPVLYCETDENMGYWPENEFYYMYQNYAENRSCLRNAAACFFIGLFLLVCYLFVRKEKREAGKKAAGLTENMWFEWKLLLFFAVPFVILEILWKQSETYWAFSDYAAELSYANVSSSEYAYEITEYFLDALSGHIGGLLLVFWAFHLFVSDLFHNRGSYKKGGLGKFFAALEIRSFMLPLSKRIVRRSYAVILLTFAQFCFLLGFIIFVIRKGYGIGIENFLLMAFTIALLITEYVYQQKNRQFASDLEKLSERISAIRGGDYGKDGIIQVQDADMRHMAAELEDIRKGLETAVEERTGSERMKVELVANVSHDIKTPLTSIISYIQLLKQEENLPEHVRDYIRILDEKSERLKNMVQDVFAVSKAASGQLDVELKELDLRKLLEQTLADMEEVIQNSVVVIKTEIPKEAMLVQADGGRMYRVFQNLIGNALKYSLEGSRIYITLKREGESAVASIKNTSSRELDQKTDFAGRFVRGDLSRTDGGSGLGLSIAKSFTEACGGSFMIETIADLFVVTVSFQIL